MKALLDRLAGFISYRRRIIGALFAAVAVVLTVQSLRHPPALVEAAVVSKKVVAGQTLTSADVSTVRIPAASTPQPMRVEEVVGQVVTSSLAQGTALQPGMLLAGPHIPSGRAIVPLPLRNRQLAPLLVPGTRVALVIASGDSTHLITNNARVASAPSTASDSPMSLAAHSDQAAVLLEVAEEDATEIAALAQGTNLGMYVVSNN